MADLGAYQVNVRFSNQDAQTLIAACNNAAAAIDGQTGSMQSARTTGEEQFKGYFSTLFRSNGATQVKDASELSSALRQVAKMTGELQKAADAEQQRRVKARAWEAQQQHRSTLSKLAGDVSHLWGGDEPPVPGPASQLRQSAPKPAGGKRETPEPGAGGGSSSGTSSAIPDNLTSFASTTRSNNSTLTTHRSNVSKAYSAFTASCGWGSLDASGVLTGFEQFIQGNEQEVRWANTIAAAFAKAGGSGSVRTLSNQALGAALRAAHVAATRADLKIDLPSVVGGVPTSGFANDPVNTATGNFTEPETDFAFTDACSTLVFTRTYNSVADVIGGFGPGWSSWSETRLVLGENEARWVLPEGRHIVFPRTADGWDRATGASYWLAADGDGLLVSDNNGGRWSFTAGGRLEFFHRGEGTRVDLMYQGDGRFAGLVHERGRSVSVEWSGDLIVRATASDGRQIDYGYDEHGRLTSAAGPLGVRRYVWGEASALIEQVIDGDGVVEALNGYDGQGRVAWQRSPFGRTTRFTYLPGGVTEVADTDGERANTWIADGAGRLIGAIDSDGHRQSYAWDASGNMVEAVSRVGERTVREYDERGRLIHEVRPTGADFQYGYDDLDRVTTVAAGSIDGAGGDAVTTYEYAGTDRGPSLIVDPSGGRTTMVWRAGLLTETTDPTGVTLRFDYDAHGELIAVTNAVGNVAHLERDDAGRVTAAVTPSGRRTSYAYDDAGLPVSRRDPDGGVWRFERSAAGRLTAEIAPDGGRTEFHHGPDGTASRIIDPLGRVTTRTMDDLGNLATLRLPDGSTWSYTHDALSRLVQAVDPTGGVWTRRYDADGDLAATVDPTGVQHTVTSNRGESTVTVDDGLMAATLTLDALGRPRSVRSTADDADTFVYDASGRVIEILDGEGALTLIHRDAAGRPIQVIDPTGVTVEYGYDACGRLSRVIDAHGGVTTREYDADSLLVRQTLPTGEAAWAKYDPCGRLVQLYQPGAGTATYTYDRCGRVTSAVDPWWGTRRFSYDQAGQLTAVTNGLGGVTRYEYDENGRLVTVTDPAGGVRRRTWDAMGRLLSETDALGRTTSGGYDAAGRQTWQREADGHTFGFAYDASGRNISTSVDDVVVMAVTRDLRERTQTIDDRTGPAPVTHVKEWDRAGRLIRHTRTTSDGESRGMAWSYDGAGRRVRMVDAFGRATVYHYDTAGRLVGVEHPTLGTVALTHDAAGHLIAVTTTDPAGRSIRQVWDWVDGAIAAHTTTNGDETVRTVIERDADGRVTAITRDGETTRYSYDDAAQLTAAIGDGSSHEWTFDANGRLTRHNAGQLHESYEYDAAGQLVAVDHGDGRTTAHEYDLGGARTRSIRSDGSRREYDWTPTGWLAQLTDADADGRFAGITLGTDATGELAHAGTTTLWWDTADAVPTLAGVGDTPVLPLGPVTGIGREWITPGWRAGRADSVDPWQVAPVVTLSDGLGLTATGTLTLGSAIRPEPLEWLGARAYDPATRGFLAVDPLPPVTGAGWAANPYNYAGNNPLAFSDPTGLHPLTDAELRAQTRGWLDDAWHAASNWATTGWGAWVVGGLMTAGGVAMMATGFGGPLGMAMFAAGTDTLIQKATTGNVDYKQVGMMAVVGGVTGGAGLWAEGVAAGANGTAALTTSIGINAGLGAGSSEAMYAVEHHSDLTWQGALGAAAGGALGGAVGGAAGPAGGTIAKNIFSDADGASAGLTSKALSIGINSAGGAAGDLTSQALGSPGQPINWKHVAISGAATGVTGAGLDKVTPEPRGVNTIEQQSHFGVRSTQGLQNFAAKNTRALWGSGVTGAIVGAAEGPGIDKLAP